MIKSSSGTEQTEQILLGRSVDVEDKQYRMPVKQENVELETATVRSSATEKNTEKNTSLVLPTKTEHQGEPSASIDEAEEEADSDSTPAQEQRTIRVVSIEKLLCPSLVGQTADINSKTEKSVDKTRTSSCNAKKNASIIEISDEESESSLSTSCAFPQAVLKKLSLEKKNEESVAGRTGFPLMNQKTNEKKAQSSALSAIQDLNVVVTRLPEDLSEIKSRFQLKIICDLHNIEINRITSSNSAYLSGKKDSKQTDRGKKQAPVDGELEISIPETKNDSDEMAKKNDNDSDEPIRGCNDEDSIIPKAKKMIRNMRKRRAVSDSDHGDDLAKYTNGKASTESEADSDKEIDFSTKTTSSSRSRRAAERSKRTALEKSAEDDKDDGEEFQLRKKRTRIRRNSPSSSDDGADSGAKSKNRKRIKKKKADDDSDGDSPSKGRKNIRKLLKKDDLEQTTKNAEQEERERKQRIIERQKIYNQVYDETPEEAKTLEQLVLDFDEETKQPLLEVDKKLVKHLKPHQANGIKFMFDACFESIERMKEDDGKGSGCILAHCMGLGKTLQVVALAHTLLSNADVTEVERILIVCPLSTVLNWVNEFNIWTKHVRKGTELEVYEISKYKNNVMRANKLMEWHNDGGVMIMGYDMFRNLSNPTASRIRKKVRESLQTSLINPGPELIVCDEGHLLKNEKTSLSQMINRIRTLRRIVLTGTPIQNNMKEYYCMVQFVKPKLLGTYNEYMNRFVNPITNGQYTDSTPYDIQLMRKRAHVLHKLLDGCVQRRDYSVLAPFLPPKLEFVLSIKLTALQTTLYKHYMENFAGKRIVDDPLQKRSSLFLDFQNLQRIWTHPRVLRYNSDRYEIVQQKKRDLDSDLESSASIKDFLDDESDESADSTPESSETEKDEVKSSGGTDENSNGTNNLQTVATRRTRKHVVIEDEVIEKPENPTEWWMQLCPETELDKLEHSGKLLLLMEILKECETIGDKLLVFSQSLYSLDVIEHFLSLLDENTQKEEAERDETLSKYPASWAQGLDYFRLDGSTPIEHRNDACKVFNDEHNPRARLFLISTRAGGLGINLVAANRVVIFDVSWNPSHDIQSIFRVYRFGQNKPCYIYRFIAMGTMEEKIYERQVTKQAISKRVIDEQQIDRHYKETDLQELYRYDVDTTEPRQTPNLPKDRLFAELLQRFESIIYKYHEHESLLENKEEETLNEEERKAAWEEFEQEKNRPPIPYANMNIAMGMGMGVMGGMAGRVNGPTTSSNLFGFRNDVLLKLLNLKAREDNPAFNDNTINALIPYMMQELTRQMREGEMTLYRGLCDLYYKLEIPAANQHYPMGYAMQGAIGVPPTQQAVVQQPIMLQTNQPLPTSSGITPQYTIDPEVVELD